MFERGLITHQGLDEWMTLRFMVGRGFFFAQLQNVGERYTLDQGRKGDIRLTASVDLAKPIPVSSQLCDRLTVNIINAEGRLTPLGVCLIPVRLRVRRRRRELALGHNDGTFL